MNSHGGYREGAGRPARTPNKATSDHKSCLSKLARQHTSEAIETLVEIMRNGQADNTRLSAANSLLDRGYGRPDKAPQINIEHTNQHPTKIELIGYIP